MVRSPTTFDLPNAFASFKLNTFTEYSCTKIDCGGKIKERNFAYALFFDLQIMNKSGFDASPV